MSRSIETVITSFKVLVDSVTFKESSTASHEGARDASPVFDVFAPLIQEFTKKHSILARDNITQMMEIIEICKYYNFLQMDDATAKSIICANEYPGARIEAFKFIEMIADIGEFIIHAITPITEDNHKELNINIDRSHWLVSAPSEGNLAVDETITLLEAHPADIYTCMNTTWAGLRAALYTLKDGGNAILHTAGVDENVIIAAAGCFENCYVCKPTISSPLTKDLFVIGIGLKKTSNLAAQIMNAGPYQVINDAPTPARDMIKNIKGIIDRRVAKYTREVEMRLKSYQKHDFDEICNKFAENWLARAMFTSTAFNKFVIPFNHHRQYYIQFGKSPEFAPLSRTLSADAPETPYERRIYMPKSVKHWGQLKLLLNEIEFCTKIYDKNDDITLLYAGAAPGSHQKVMLELFPKFKYVLYDPNPFDEDLVTFASTNPGRIQIHQEYFTDEIAQKYAKEGSKLIFICDIRSSAENVNDFEENVHRDLDMQRHWVEIMRPAHTQLKFRFPFDSKELFEYFDGDIYIQPYPPAISTETRLTFSGVPAMKKYDPIKYESQLYYHNTVARVMKYPMPPNPPPELDECFDCASYMYILSEYIARIAPEKNHSEIMNLIRRLNYLKK
jgi:hypothetical protein